MVVENLAAKPPNPGARGKQRTLLRKLKQSAAMVASTAVVATGLIAGGPVFADDGGAGATQPGSGGGSYGGEEFRFWTFDNGAPGSSVLTAPGGLFSWDQWQESYGQKPDQTYVVDRINAACDNAFTDAISQHGGTRADYRIVLAGGFVGNGAVNGKVFYGGLPPTYLDNALLDQWGTLKNNLNAITTTGNPPHRPNPAEPALIEAYRQSVLDLALSVTGSPNGARAPQICVVLHKDQPLAPPPVITEYDVRVTTVQQDGFTVSGGTQAVRDEITTTAPDAPANTQLNGRVILNWDGYPAGGTVQKSVSKDVTLPANGTTLSPTFTPSDFGWDVWPAGRFWYDVVIPKQGDMSAGVDTDNRIPSETWVANPNGPSKVLRHPVTGADLGDSPQVASGSTINAEISMDMAGISTGYIRDILEDGRVWIGGKDSDSPAGVKVLDPNGSELPADRYEVTITGDESGKIVTAKITGDAMSGRYTLVVPTTPWPTATDYSFADRGQVCYSTPSTDPSVPGDCVDTPTKTPGKVTPDPDKAWVLDENGGLATSDPNWTNDVGADNGTFFPGDSISSVVNGKLPRDLAVALDGYQILDDWTQSAEYIDFTDASLAKVYVDGANVTDQFDVVVDGTRTIATAKAGSNILTTSANQSSDRVVKLIITGQFKDADTGGKQIELKNEGHERWNNDGRDTNIPSVFIRTPSPDKVWVLDSDGALVYGDADWTNNVGSDNAVFLHGDTVGVVVNGTLPRGLATNMSAYQIADDWSKAAKYVDFSDASQAKVFVDGVDMTSDFDITVDGTTTIATAKASLLATTAGQSADRAVKLFVTGSFKQIDDETDTKGEVIRLLNNGWELWNTDRKPTNEPPVYIWNPSPEKDVIGSADQGGDQDSINGQMVFPGQIIEYQVNLDLRVPAGTAYDINNFQVEDNYDPMFAPNKSSLEIYDTRTNKTVPRTQWDVAWNDEANQFVVTFKPEWVQQFVDSNNGGWLIMRFDGRVSMDATPGEEITNIAYQILNQQRTPTPEPVVSVPPTSPDKEDLRCEVNVSTGQFADCVDIDGKVVVKGDFIDYRLTLDARPSRDKLAYNVHKLGMVDDFDEEFLALSQSDVQVVNSVTGENVTDAFNIQILDGKAYIFAKTVDSVNIHGDELPGDPQPANLAEYAMADIDPLNDPIIDQGLLGNIYHVYLRTKVTQEVDDYVIENQAEQNFENMWTVTKVVYNPLKELSPEKDVTVEVDGESINKGEVALHGNFNYLLKSSTIPADRAHISKDWSIVDDYNEEADRYLGEWVVRATTDLYLDDVLIANAGQTIASSRESDPLAGIEGVSVSLADLFEVTESNGVIRVVASDKYLDVINTRTDLAQGWEVYVGFQRITAGDVTNIFTEIYNGEPRDPQEVITHTPENPEIALVKYDLESGVEDGDRNVADDALVVDGDTEIGFLITNTGDVPLVNVVLADETTDGSGTVSDITCDPALEGLTLDVGETVLCVGTLTDLTPGTTHANLATVTGESVYTGDKVSDDDPWHAKVKNSGGTGDSNEVPDLPNTGSGPVVALGALAGLLLAAGTGFVTYNRKKSTN